MTDAPQSLPSDPSLTDDLWADHKISPDERAKVLEILGREPTYAELGVFSVMWSEHCSYKSSRVHLGRLPTEGEKVIQGPGENAGVVDIGDGFAAVFKMESHNHPSYLEPYQGAATGVGGIMRDVFTMGARPIAALNSLRFGRPDHPRTRELLTGVVAGIGGYGNCFGVPTVGGEVQFDKRYDGNILVNAFSCGVAPSDGIFYGRAEGVGNPVLYVGARTGRDGIHGATMASDEFSEDGPNQRPTVQVGDPFMEKLLLEACLEIFKEDLLIGIQDMGAAGLTSSSVEMASRSGSGLELDLDDVPRRARALTPYEMLLSESQERMLLVAKPGCEDRVLEICDKWDLEAAVIGKVTDTGRWVIKATPGFDPLSEEPAEKNPIVVCDLPVAELADAAPKYDRPQSDDPTLDARLAFDPATIEAPESWTEALLGLVAQPNLGSRQWIYRQYDSIVRGGTAVGPGSDAAVVRVPCEKEGTVLNKWLAFSADCNGRHVDLDPFNGAAMAVAEACRNLAVSGAEAIGLTDCMNFGSAENPAVMRQFARSVDGIAAACNALGVPVVSGNVSLYNDTDGRPILPTPTIAAVGQVAEPEHITPMGFQAAESIVFALGDLHAPGLGGSEWVAKHTGETQGPAPKIDLAQEAKLQKLCLQLTRGQKVRSLHDVAEGGLAVALAEAAAGFVDANDCLGATLSLPPTKDVANLLFGEAPTRVVGSCNANQLEQVQKLALTLQVPVTILGTVGGSQLVIKNHKGEGLIDAPVAELRERRLSCLSCLTAIVGEENRPVENA